MCNCKGWNEGSGKVARCFIDSDICRYYAEFNYNFLLLSAFWLMIPLGIYALLTYGFISLVTKAMKMCNYD